MNCGKALNEALLNSYGDVSVPAARGHGMDIASQRADTLDLLALERIGALRGAADGTPAVHALDVGCGKGGQAARMAQAGAQVLAVDVEDCAQAVRQSMRAAGVDDRAWIFRRRDIADIGLLAFRPQIVVCQRMIHYLRHGQALRALRALQRLAAPGAMLYLSASGLDSMLGDGYGARELDLRQRFAPLRPDRAREHNIHRPVCLYREPELAALARASGWEPREVFRSDFGNIKLVACKAC